MSVAYIIEALYEETLRLLDREAEIELGQIGRQFLRWLDNHLPRMPYDGWRDDFDDFIAMLAREHAIVAEESYHAWIQWLQEANDAAKLEGREPGTLLPFRFYTYDNKYAPPKVTLNKPAPFDPDYPQLRGTGNAIMEHNPPERWVDLAKLCLQSYRVPQEIKDAFVGWIEEEQRKTMAERRTQFAGGVLAHNQTPGENNNAAMLDRAFPEPPFAEMLGLPKVNNPPFGDTARRYGFPFPRAGVASTTSPGAAQAPVDALSTEPIAGQMEIEIPADFARGIPGGMVAIGIELTDTGLLRLNYAELASKLDVIGLSDDEQKAIRKALQQKVTAEGNTLFKTWTKKVQAQRKASGHKMGTVNPTKTNAVLNAKARLLVRAGRGLVLAGLTIDVYRVATAPDGEKLETAAKAGGGLAGGLVGAKIGAITFSWAGPAGVVVGAFVIGTAGAFLGEEAVDEMIHRPPGPHVDLPPVPFFFPYSPRPGEPEIY